MRIAGEILRQEKLREEMGRCSARKAADFTSDVFAGKMLSVYEDAAAEFKKHYTNRKRYK